MRFVFCFGLLLITDWACSFADDASLPDMYFERKQTGGIAVNYDGPDDGKIDLDPQRFPEAPYGFMTWVNTDGDFYPGADRAWAWAAGAGGTRVLWNGNKGIVFAAFGADKGPICHSVR